MSTYWMYDWLDENEVKAPWEINNAIGTARGFKRLAELQEEAFAAEENSEQILPQRSIVAGRSLDLSGNIACGGYACLQRDIDMGFLQIWHYFDGIVVSRLNPGLVYDAVRNDGRGGFARTRVLDYLRILLYIRAIGAEPWVTFADKAQELHDHDWRSLARSLNVIDAFEGPRNEQLVKAIARNTHFNVRRIQANQWDVHVSGGYFKTGQSTVMNQSTRPTIEDLSRRILKNYGLAAIEDVAAAQNLSLPLVQPTSVPWISGKKHTPTQDEVALQLRLPVFSDLNVADFLKLREDERPAFELFRTGLRDQIQSKLDSAARGDTAAGIARNVEDDYLRPGLAEIEQRIRGSRKALIKRTSISLGIGTSAATISAMSSVPMMIAGSVVALGSAVPLAPLLGSYIDEVNKEIPMHKLYFLWRLKKQGKHWSKHR